MEHVTLERIHEDLLMIKKEIDYIKAMIEEDFELADGVVEEIEKSRKRQKKEFVSHEDMKKEFG